MDMNNVFYKQVVDSTNLWAKEEGQAGAAHGSVYMADMQTSGRGRRGRVWESPPGDNLYFSLLLRPDFAPDKASMLTLVMAMAVAEAVRSYGAVADIKWPNDIVVNGKKLCGILTEMHMESNGSYCVIVGVGVNVKQRDFAPEIADMATSLQLELNIEADREKLLEKILNAFEKFYREFTLRGDFHLLLIRYNDILINRGKLVKVLDPKGEFTGIARGINELGELLVEKENGETVAVYAGEVSVRGLYGYT